MNLLDRAKAHYTKLAQNAMRAVGSNCTHLLVGFQG